METSLIGLLWEQLTRRSRGWQGKKGDTFQKDTTPTLFIHGHFYWSLFEASVKKQISLTSSSKHNNWCIHVQLSHRQALRRGSGLQSAILIIACRGSLLLPIQGHGWKVLLTEQTKMEQNSEWGVRVSYVICITPQVHASEAHSFIYLLICLSYQCSLHHSSKLPFPLPCSLYSGKAATVFFWREIMRFDLTWLDSRGGKKAACMEIRSNA